MSYKKKEVTFTVPVIRNGLTLRRVSSQDSPCFKLFWKYTKVVAYCYVEVYYARF